jgi:hypothetical protein
MSQARVVKVEDVERRPDSYVLGQRVSSQEKFNVTNQDIEGNILNTFCTQIVQVKSILIIDERLDQAGPVFVITLSQII